MKTRIATAISVAGVLMAGSAAAMVNTSVFEGEPSFAGESAALLAPEPNTVELTTVDLTGADVALPEGQAAAGSSVSGVVAGMDSQTAPASAYLTEYAVGDAGTVTVDVIDGRLRLVSVVPSPGWTIDSQEEYPSGDHVEVELRGYAAIVKFEADLVGNEIIPSVDVTQLTEPAPQATSSYHDDDDDDHYEDDDHGRSHDEDDDDRYEDHDDD